MRIVASKRSFLVVFAATVVLIAFTASGVVADDWPQWLGPERGGIWRETGILSKFSSDGPKVRWRTSIGSGYAGPAVAGGKVFITDRTLDKNTRNPDNAFARSRVPGEERVLCLDEATGRVLWTHAYECAYAVSYPAGPRATPLIHEDKVYTLGTMGNLLCLNVSDGKVIWSKDFVRDYEAPMPVWGFAAHPLLDGDKLICLVGGPDHIVMAFDKNTGKELWHTLSAREPGYCPPMIYTFGGKRQLIIWHPQAVVGLNPDDGKELWSVPFESKAGLSVPTPRQAGDLLFITAFYDGAMMLKFAPDNPKPTVLWKGKVHSERPDRTDTLHSIIPTPFLKDGYIYGICSYGELRCLRADTGERVWESLQATGSAKTDSDRWKNAFLVPSGDRVFLFNESGDLIIARLTRQGYEEIDRAHILEPTNTMAGRPVVWSHPAFADRCVFARNDKEIVCVSLAAENEKRDR
jgi:outer membrane protein assembly factor BamB